MFTRLVDFDIQGHNPCLLYTWKSIQKNVRDDINEIKAEGEEQLIAKDEMASDLPRRLPSEVNFVSVLFV
jgi:hypothetical protein